MKKTPITTDETFEDIRLTLDEIRQLPESEIQQLLNGARTMISNFMPPNQMQLVYNEKSNRITLLLNYEVIPTTTEADKHIKTVLSQRNDGAIDYTGMEKISTPQNTEEFLHPVHISTYYPELAMAAKFLSALSLIFAQSKDESVDRIIQQEIRSGKRLDMGSSVLNRVFFFADLIGALAETFMIIETRERGLINDDQLEALLSRLTQSGGSGKPKRSKASSNSPQPIGVFSKGTIGRA